MLLGNTIHTNFILNHGYLFIDNLYFNKFKFNVNSLQSNYLIQHIGYKIVLNITNSIFYGGYYSTFFIAGGIISMVNSSLHYSPIAINTFDETFDIILNITNCNFSYLGIYYGPEVPKLSYSTTLIDFIPPFYFIKISDVTIQVSCFYILIYMVLWLQMVKLH